MRIRPGIAAVLTLSWAPMGALFLAFTAAQAQSPAPAVVEAPTAAKRDVVASRGRVPVVLELFTSQGCSSCPPADALFATYAQRDDVMALSFAVDYWDHLGWRDTLAGPRNTARQRAYAKSLGTGNVYTPQMVVNGIAQAVGSQKHAIDKAMSKSALDPSLAVPVKAGDDGTRTTIEIGAQSAEVGGASGTVWLVKIAPQVAVDIKKGENRGKTISYVNVVREISAVGMWSGKPVKIELPSAAVMEPGLSCAVIVQSGETGPILGATWVGR